MIEIQPFGDRIAVRIIKPEIVESGLIISTASEETSNKGTVIATGNGDEAKEISLGDVVLFVSGSGTYYADEENAYRVLNVRDIIGKVVIKEND